MPFIYISVTILKDQKKKKKKRKKRKKEEKEPWMQQQAE